MKKLIAVLCAGMLCLVTGCSAAEPGSSEPETAAAQTETSAETAETAEETTAPAETTAETTEQVTTAPETETAAETETTVDYAALLADYHNYNEATNQKFTMGGISFQLADYWTEDPSKAKENSRTFNFYVGKQSFGTLGVNSSENMFASETAFRMKKDDMIRRIADDIKAEIKNSDSEEGTANGIPYLAVLHTADTDAGSEWFRLDAIMCNTERKTVLMFTLIAPSSLKDAVFNDLTQTVDNAEKEAPESPVKLINQYVTKDWGGTRVLVLEFEYTNTGTGSQMFSTACSVKAFQNSVGLDNAFLVDGVDYSSQLKEVLPGGKVTVQEAFELSDGSAVSVRVTDLLGLKTYLTTQVTF